MNMKALRLKYLKHLIIVLLTFSSNYLFATMTLNWNESSTIHGGKVEFAANVDFKLPTNDIYEVGFFINSGGGLYTCAGKADITPGAKFIVIVSGDPLGNLGYKNNQKYISFVRIKNSSTNLYGVEFNYRNDSSTYYNNVKNTVIGIKFSTWFNTLPAPKACINQDSLLIQLPYGVIPDNVTATNGMSVEKLSDEKILVRPKNFALGTYTINFPCSWLTNSFLSYTFSITTSPTINNPIVNEILCLGDTIKLPKVDLQSGLKRIPKLSSYTLNLYSIGSYDYIMKDTVTGCFTYQTYNITKCTETLKNKIFVNIANNEFVQFESTEKIEIFDISLNKVKTIIAPQTWRGEDENGNTLPLGMYIVINSKKEVTYVTLVY